ncbi:hypothetical protein HWC35_gp100 [Vibrio phage USC-1]|uniref:Uncharacterized protein n=2 Tax=Aphroditevirus USC1 TaxID=2846605 RepID=A0A514A2I2_9CAUD|nr:hypothetical protein HWC35_gp100 [Vibrio phage USC-1]QCW23234.1 hypothetical protein [Vibrio phage 5 TSL-2019]QDH47494.1 hypothetical protein [Vibrio phage USC-1]
MIGDVQHQTIALILHRAAYGRLNGPLEPGDDIRLIEDEKDYSHPWSIEQRAHTYAFYELKEIFGDINTYMSFPPKVAAQIVKGMRKGSEELMERRRQADISRGKSSEQRSLEEQLDELSKMEISSGSK